MADYNSLKVPDLKKLLQTRSLPVSGNKAELVARLQESDDSRANANSSPNPNHSKGDEDKEKGNTTELTSAAAAEKEASPSADATAGVGSTSKDPTQEEESDNDHAVTAGDTEEGSSAASGDPDTRTTIGGEDVIAPPAHEEIDRGDASSTGKSKNKPSTGDVVGGGGDGGRGGGGGRGRASNLLAVPNQKVDFDPSKTHDLKVHRDNPVPSTTNNKDTKPKPTETTITNQPAAAAKSGFTAGLSITNIDEEIERRKARARRFQTQPKNEDASSNDKETTDVDPAATEAIKALERAKRFGPVNGTGPNTTTTNADGSNAVQIKGLDQALPERTRRKRGRENDQADDRGEKRRRQGDGGDRGGARGGRGRGRGGRGRGGSGGGGGRSGDTSKKPTTGKITDDPVEKAKAEARAKKFGAGNKSAAAKS